MTMSRSLLILAVAAILFHNPQSTIPKLLYLTHSAGFRHDVLPLTREVVPELGRAGALFEATVTEECSLISSAGLKSFDAVFFYTTGELPMDDTQKRALVEFVRSGHGFIGAHSATDTFYKWPEYGEMIGGYFDGHPWHEEVGVRVEDASHPATRHLPPRFTLTDEIYQFRNWSRPGVHVLLSLDPASVDLTKAGVHRTDRDFALAWTRPYGKGRVFYTALGHRPEVWRDERFREHLRGGIAWAIGVEEPR
jgi:hypothetical protein